MNFCCKFFKLKFSNESSPSLPPPVETYKVSTGGLSRVYAEKTVFSLSGFSVYIFDIVLGCVYNIY